MRSHSITSIDSFAPKTYDPILDLKSSPSKNHTSTPQQTTAHQLATQPHLGQRKRYFPANIHSNPLRQNTSYPSHRFSERIKHLIQHAISHAWATSTTNKYSNTIRLFHKFCDLENIPNHLRFPADEFVLCAFAASGAGISSFRTIRGKIAALKAWHHRHDTEWKGSMRLQLVLNGVKNLAPKSSSKPPRPPISAKMLNQLIQGLDLSDPLDSAVAACATVAFWGQCRLGELLPTAAYSFSTSSNPSRSDIRRSTRNKDSYLLFLPRTKTNRSGQNIVLTNQIGDCCPLKALKNHFKINQLSRKLPLFAYTSPRGIHNLTKRRFLSRCNSIWTKLGYPRTTGHSFRIGGTTELLLAGVPPDVVKTLGRWSSDSFLRYWRLLDEIAPRYSRKIDYRPNLKRKRRNSSP